MITINDEFVPMQSMGTKVLTQGGRHLVAVPISRNLSWLEVKNNKPGTF
jgi:hypothetical protein